MRPFPVATDQIPDVFTDVLVSAVLPGICGEEFAERAVDADGQGGSSEYGSLPSNYYLLR